MHFLIYGSVKLPSLGWSLQPLLGTVKSSDIREHDQVFSFQASHSEVPVLKLDQLRMILRLFNDDFSTEVA
jgi:hypothetical protein